jgi:phospholipid/cholesterol/gamma-HCH transport system permease protein
MLTESEPTLNCCPDAPERIILQGAWIAHRLAKGQRLAEIQNALNNLRQQPGRIWDLRELAGLDHLGAQLLWRCWGRKLPDQILCTEQHEGLFLRLSQLHPEHYPPPVKARLTPLMQIGNGVITFFRHASDMAVLLGQLVFDLLQFMRHP